MHLDHADGHDVDTDDQRRSVCLLDDGPVGEVLETADDDDADGRQDAQPP